MNSGESGLTIDKQKFTGTPTGCYSDSIYGIKKFQAPLLIRHYYIKSKEEFMRRCESNMDNIGI